MLCLPNSASTRRFASAAGLAAALFASSIARAAGPSLFLDQSPATSDFLPPRAEAAQAEQVRLNPKALSAQQIRWQLPGGREWALQRVAEVQGPRGERTWVGEFVGHPGSLLSLTSFRGFVSGFAHIGTETWEIEGLGQGRAQVFRVDETRLPPEGHPRHVPVAGETTTATQTGGTAGATVQGEVVTQDLLLVYTSAAANSNGGPSGLETKLVSAVAAANQAYASSGINLRLNVVGMQQIAYVETGDMGLTLSRLQGTSDGYMDDVHGLRNQVGADLVGLISNDTNYCGIAYVMQGVGSGFASYAFSVTAPGCLAGHTLAHEIGHNQGNAHDRPTGGAGAYPYSYGYRTCDYPALANGQTFRTVMAYSCAGTPRVNNFSSPDVFYNNAAPMGIDYEQYPTDAADNARSMNATASTIAAFRAGPAGAPPSPPTGLSGSTPAFDRIDLTWADNSPDESGFVVQRATGGGAFSDRATLAANVTSFADTGLQGGTSYSYRVRAFNSAGASAYSNQVTVVTPAAPPPPANPQPVVVTIDGSSVAVSWANVSNETGYEIRRETYNARKATWSASITSVGADVTAFLQTLSAGTYRYSVRAIGASGASDWVGGTCTGCAGDGSFTIQGTKKGGSGGPKGGR